MRLRTPKAYHTVARGQPRFAAPPRVHAPANMSGEPKTACQTGGLRARNRPRTASTRRARHIAPPISVSASAALNRDRRLDRPLEPIQELLMQA